MKAWKLKCVVLAMLSLAGGMAAHAQDNGEDVFYLGGGSAKSSNSAYSSGDTPKTFGYLKLSNLDDTVWGIDVSAEGTMFDSTYGQDNAAKQATSVNALIGQNIATSGSFRMDAAFIAGVRDRTTSCPPSYVGYQCYANTVPDTSYAFNYGVALTVSYKNILLGVRATGESTQAMVGIRF